MVPPKTTPKIEGLSGESDESTKAEDAVTVQIREQSDAHKVNETEPKSEINSYKADANDNERSDGNADSALTKEDAVEETSKRLYSSPSSILEKGILYFFRGRLSIEEPSNLGDIAGAT